MSEPRQYTMVEQQLMSQAVYEKIASRDPQLLKEAEGVINDYTRTKMREEGFLREFIPLVPLPDNEIDRAMDTALPVKIIDREPDSPAAISVGFNTWPDTLYIEGERYRVLFDRIMSTRFTKDVAELRTWIMDIRMVLSDNSIKDMQAEEDGKLLRCVNTAIVGPGLVVPTTGTVQHQVIRGGITRDSLWDSLKLLEQTPQSLATHSVLLNSITIKEVCKFTGNEMGGKIAEDIMRSGWTYAEFMGIKWVITIKKGLVPTNTFYHWADPNHIGKGFEIEPVTMYLKREAFMIEFFNYEQIGVAIGNVGGVGRVDFK